MTPDRRLAQALHDGVAQRLIAVSAALNSGDELAPGDRDRCRAELEAVIAELRALIEEGADPDGDACIGLERLIRDFVLEAIRNAEKHARPHVIAFSGSLSGDRIHLEVINDGVSGSTDCDGTHLGLRLIGGEALRHGGWVDAQPIGPDGWCTTLTLPRKAS